MMSNGAGGLLAGFTDVELEQGDGRRSSASRRGETARRHVTGHGRRTKKAAAAREKENGILE